MSCVHLSASRFSPHGSQAYLRSVSECLKDEKRCFTYWLSPESISDPNDSPICSSRLHLLARVISSSRKVDSRAETVLHVCAELARRLSQHSQAFLLSSLGTHEAFGAVLERALELIGNQSLHPRIGLFPELGVEQRHEQLRESEPIRCQPRPCEAPGKRTETDSWASCCSAVSSLRLLTNISGL